jgi:hypothetical protein
VRLRFRSQPSVYPRVPYTLTLDTPLVVMLRNTNKHFWHRCRGTVVVNLRTRLSSYLLFFPFFCTSTPLSMEGYPCTHLPPVKSESEEPSSPGPIPFSSCMIHPFLMRLVQKNSFSGTSHENPYDHVRDYENPDDTRCS